LAILEEIFVKHGVDSYIGRCASVVMASSEAIFYITAVYFSKTEVEKYKFLIPLALLVNTISAIISCFVCRFV